MSSLPYLGVNIDHVATIRQARKTPYPDVVAIACLLEQEQACDSITVHLREDRRHIQYEDVKALKKRLTVPLNLEMAPTAEMLQVALDVKPQRVCLVPEKRRELTTEGGLAIDRFFDSLDIFTSELQRESIQVSLFIEPTHSLIQCARHLNAHAVELHTGSYACANGQEQVTLLEQITAVAHEGTNLGLAVHAGHGLTRDNVAPLAAISDIIEFNIGHAIVADAFTMGIVAAAKEMKQRLFAARPSTD